MVEYRRYSIVVKKNNPLYQEIDRVCFLSKNLFNSTLYAERQSLFKDGVFKFYNKINKEFVVNNQPDYRALPTKVSKHTQMKVNEAIKSFIKLKKSNINFKPKLPKYLDKDGRFVTEYERGALSFKKDGFIKLSKTNIIFPTKFKKGDVKVVRLIPKTGYYLIEILYDKKIKKVKNKRNKKFASIDLGLNNLATVTSNSFNPFIINGKPLKSINQYSNKMIAKYQSLLPSKQYSSNKINFIRYKREMKVNDYLSKSAKYLVNYLVSQSIDVMVIGTNAGWKQNINIGKRNNQNFANIPFYKFKNKLAYLCEEAGIEVVEQEESYTSKSSFLDNDPIPTYPNTTNISFSGKRVCRGLYKSKNKTINADVNGSLNILKKYLISNAAWNGNVFSDLVEACSTPRKVTVSFD